MKKLIALLLSLAMCFALIPAITAGTSANAGLTPAEKEARIESLLAYTDRLNAMTREYSLADAKKDIDNPFANARIIVKSSEALDYTGSIAHVNGYNDLHVIQYAEPAEAEAAMKQYEALSCVQYAEPDCIFQICATLGDFDYLFWGYGEEHVVAQVFIEWLLSEAGSVEALPEIIVAVIDTGADSDHPMIMDRLVPGYDFVNNDSNPEDDHRHGTHVSGTIIDGTLGNVKVMPLKALDNEGYGNATDIAAAMEYAVLNGCSAINMSLSGGCTDDKHQLYEECVELGLEYNCVFCVAAGNNSSDAGARCPANIEDCITVAAYASNNIFADYSNFGDCVDITAPGTAIRSARMGGGYVEMDGTSMATPHVAAACAMLKSYDPDMSVEEMTYLIKANSKLPQFPGGGAGCLSVNNILRFFDLNGENSFMKFSSDSEHPWIMANGSAHSGNAGFNSTTSTLTGTAVTKPYQLVSFEYKVSSQQPGDYLRFSIDGESKLEASGNQNWQTFSCIIPGDGESILTWDFIKDASGASGDDCAYIRNVVIHDTISSVLNADGSCFEFISSGSYPWTIDGNAVKSGNAGVNNSVSTMTTTVELIEGMSVAFDYKVSALTGDNFTLKINGQTLINTNDAANYTHYEYQASATGSYALEFTFTKDASGASGSDCAWVKEFSIGYTLNSALNVPGGHLNFDFPDQYYPWEVENDYAKSGNAGHAGSTSYFKLTIDLEAGDTISFDYKVSSETNYDKFFFYVNDSAVVTQSGLVDWTHYTYTAPTSRTYTFKWAYTKDGSADRNDDTAYVDDIMVVSSGTQPSGDVNNDGTVNVQDALLTMRRAMNLVGDDALDIHEADINMDGTINIQDAVVIMRIGLGI